MLTMTTEILAASNREYLKLFLFVAERDGFDKCLGGPMTSFGLRPLSHAGDIDDDVGDDDSEW